MIEVLKIDKHEQKELREKQTLEHRKVIKLELECRKFIEQWA